jgi:hypothetical protein
MINLAKIVFFLLALRSVTAENIFADFALQNEHDKYSSYLNLEEGGKFLYLFHPDNFEAYEGKAKERVQSLMILHPAEVSILKNLPNKADVSFLEYLRNLVHLLNLDFDSISEEGENILCKRVNNLIAIYLYHYWQYRDARSQEVSEENFIKFLEGDYQDSVNKMDQVIANEKIIDIVWNLLKEATENIFFTKLNIEYMRHKDTFTSDIHNQYIEIEYVPVFTLSVLSRLELLTRTGMSEEHSQGSGILEDLPEKTDSLIMMIRHLIANWEFSESRPNDLWFSKIVHISKEFSSKQEHKDVNTIKNFLTEAWNLLQENLVQLEEGSYTTYKLNTELFPPLDTVDQILKEKLMMFLHCELEKKPGQESIFRDVPNSEGEKQMVLDCGSSIKNVFVTLMIDALFEKDEKEQPYKIFHCTQKTQELNVYFTYSSIIWQIASSVVYLLPVESESKLLSDNEFISRFFNDIFDFLSENIGYSLFSLFSNALVINPKFEPHKKKKSARFIVNESTLLNFFKEKMKLSLDFANKSEEKSPESSLRPISMNFFLLSLFMLKGKFETENPLCFRNDQTSKTLLTSLYIWPLSLNLQTELAEIHLKTMKKSSHVVQNEEDVKILKESALEMSKQYWSKDEAEKEKALARESTLSTFLPAFMCPKEPEFKGSEWLI